MKSNFSTKSLIVGVALLVTSALFFFANDGFGGGGMYGGGMMGSGSGRGMMGNGYANSGYGMGPGMMGNGYNNGGYGMGPGAMGNGPAYSNNSSEFGTHLSSEQRAKLEASQEKFYNDTRELRDKIQDRRNTLREELAKENPDPAKVGELQKSLSALEAEFNEKAVQHQLDLRKIAPEAFSGRGYSGYNRQQ